MRAVDAVSPRVARRRLIATGDYIEAVTPDEVSAAFPGWRFRTEALRTRGRPHVIYLTTATSTIPRQRRWSRASTECMGVAVASIAEAPPMRFDPTWHEAANGEMRYEHTSAIPAGAEVTSHLQRFLRAHPLAGLTVAGGWVLCYLPEQPPHRIAWPAEMLAQLLAGWPDCVHADPRLGSVEAAVAR